MTYLVEICQPIPPKSSLPNQPFLGTKSHIMKLRVGRICQEDFDSSKIGNKTFLPPFIVQNFISFILDPHPSSPIPLLVFIYLNPLSLCLNLSHSLSLSYLSTHTHTCSLSPHIHTHSLSSHTHTHSLTCQLACTHSLSLSNLHAHTLSQFVTVSLF